MSMDRRDFLKRAAIAPAAAMAGGLGYQRTQPRVGFIDAYGAGGIDPSRIDRVTVDGREVSYVFELDDVEGWLRRYPQPTEIVGEDVAVERLEGEIEVWWKDAGSRGSE